MSKVDNLIRCGAWLEVSTAEGRTRTCVLTPGHYDGPTSTSSPITSDESWHTDCDNAKGLDRPLENSDHRHLDPHARACLVWADSAKDAHPSDVTMPEPPDTAFMESVIRAASDAPEPNKLLVPDDTLPHHRAALNFQDNEGRVIASGTIYGPAQFVAQAVRALADAFEEDAER